MIVIFIPVSSTLHNKNPRDITLMVYPKVPELIISCSLSRHPPNHALKSPSSKKWASRSTIFIHYFIHQSLPLFIRQHFIATSICQRLLFLLGTQNRKSLCVQEVIFKGDKESLSGVTQVSAHWLPHFVPVAPPPPQHQCQRHEPYILSQRLYTASKTGPVTSEAFTVTSRRYIPVYCKSQMRCLFNFEMVTLPPDSNLLYTLFFAYVDPFAMSHLL